MSSLPRTIILGSAISPPRACQQNGSKAYADYELRGSALEAWTLRQGRPPRQPSVIVSTKFDYGKTRRGAAYRRLPSALLSCRRELAGVSRTRPMFLERLEPRV